MSRQDASTTRSHLHIRSLPDLDLRSNVEIGLLGSNDISFDSPRRDKHDGTIFVSLAFAGQMLFVKNDFAHRLVTMRFFSLTLYRIVTET